MKQVGIWPELNATYDSNLRRTQRFFSKFDIDHDLFARLVFKLLPIDPPYHLSMVEEHIVSLNMDLQNLKRHY